MSEVKKPDDFAIEELTGDDLDLVAGGNCSGCSSCSTDPPGSSTSPK